MRKVADIIGKTIGALVLIAVIASIIMNLDWVTVSFFTWSETTPLGAVLAVVFILGMIVGWLLKLGNVSSRAKKVEADINQSVDSIKKLVNER